MFTSFESEGKRSRALAKPLSCMGGIVTPTAGYDRYSWTDTEPVSEPVFLILTATLMLKDSSCELTGETTSPSQENDVYDKPKLGACQLSS